MKAEERAITGVLTEQLQYMIPPYQRPYSWTEEQTLNLLEDVRDAFESDEREYFIGSLITITRQAGAPSEVVDGQQRLTTLSLIFARLREHLHDDAAKAVIGNRILPQDPLTGQTDLPRLVLRARDQKFFRDYVLGGKPLPKELWSTLDAPKRRLATNMGTADAFFADREQQWLKEFAAYLLRNVYVVMVQTESFQSAFRLFHVLNARGLGLSNADLIKNHLFSRLPDQPALHEDLETLWVELEDEVDVDQLDVFLGLHRTALTGEKARKGLAEEFEAIIKHDGRPSVDFLEQLLASARNYSRIQDGALEGTTARRSLAALKRVSYDEWVPALLAYLNRPVEGLDIGEFMSLLERITMQNWVRRLGRTKRNTVYYRLISAVNSGESAESLRKHFYDGANDKEFFAILDRELYGLPYAQAVLLRLEEGAQDTSVTKAFEGGLSIEHVLPRTMKDPYWTSRFTTQQHENWVHRLGNLTLLSGRKNGSAQNYPFPKKREIYERKNETVSFDLTKAVCAQTDWTPHIVAERHAQLMDVAHQLWAMA